MGIGPRIMEPRFFDDMVGTMIEDFAAHGFIIKDMSMLLKYSSIKLLVLHKVA